MRKVLRVTRSMFRSQAPAWEREQYNVDDSDRDFTLYMGAVHNHQWTHARHDT